MIRKMLCPGLLDTGPVRDGVLAVRDGMMNFYVVRGPAGLLCVDAGWRASVITRGFETLGLALRDVAAVLVTHLHWDHARGLRVFPDAEHFVSAQESAAARSRPHGSGRQWRTVEDGQTVTAAGLSVQVVGTPGHTAGSVSYIVDDRLLFTGDTLRLARGEVRPFPRCLNQDGATLRESIRRLARIPAIECLLTSHSGVSSHVEHAFSRWTGDVRS